ncbi:MAG: hypothetical protein CM1200mP24_03410 [Gammaproteobacteria bacterium]|nr:MAG: hypothetical protein CM1200mP24_03410 [Gammaproteobacteria bacterium]
MGKNLDRCCDRCNDYVKSGIERIKSAEKAPQSVKKIKEIITNGVFRENVAYVQLLGLCPLLAVSNTIANAIGLAAASSFVPIMSSLLVSIFRRFIVANYRLPTFVLIVDQ